MEWNKHSQATRSQVLETKMDAAKLAVLKRKRHPIALEMDLKKEYLARFRENNVDIAKNMKTIKKKFNQRVKLKRPERRTETLQYQKMMKFLELLPKAEGPGFDVLVSILEEDNYWLGEEMKAGLKEERDELVIEDYIGHLATYVGKTNYGKSLRLTAEDKTKIVFLLEEHIQYAKEVCMGRLRQNQSDLKAIRDANDLLEYELQLIIQEMNACVSKYKPKLIQAYNARKRELDENSNEVNNGRGIFDDVDRPKHDIEAAVDEFLEMADIAKSQKDKLLQERHKALAVLSVKKSSAKTEMDKELEKILMQMQRELDAKKRKSELQDEKIRKVRDQIAAVHKSMSLIQSQREREMAELTAYLTEANNYIKLVIDDILKMQNELWVLLQKCDRYKSRCQKLERTRHIGYIDNAAPQRVRLDEMKSDKKRARLPMIKPSVTKTTSKLHQNYIKTTSNAPLLNVSSNNNNHVKGKF